MESQTGSAAGTQQETGSRSLNVGATERWASLVGGSILALTGLKRGGLGGIATAVVGGALVQRGATGHCQVYERLGVSTAEPGTGDRGVSSLMGSREVHLEAAVTVDRSAEELYRFWRDPQNLPRFMGNLESVAPQSDTRAHWVMKAPVGPALEWDAEITHETAGEHIAWRSMDSSVVNHTGEVRFRPAPGGRGTEVRVRVNYAPPGGPVGAAVARLFEGLTETQLRSDLKRFKQLMETGEVATIDGQPDGR